MSYLKYYVLKLNIPYMLISFFWALLGYAVTPVKYDLGYDLFTLFFVHSFFLFGGAQYIDVFFGRYKSHHELLRARWIGLVGAVLLFGAAFVAYFHGQDFFYSTLLAIICIILFYGNIFGLLRRGKDIPGIDVLMPSFIWGALSVAMGASVAGIELTTRSFIVSYLVWYLVAGLYLTVSSNSSQEKRSTLITYLGESRSLELVGILYLFGVVGLATLVISEFDFISNRMLWFYIFFAVFSLAAIFLTLRWSKFDYHHQNKPFTWIVALLHLSIACFIIAEWLYIPPEF